MNGWRSAAVLLLLTGGAAGWPSGVLAQQTVEGPRLLGSIAELEIGGRVQTQFNTTTVQSEPEAIWFLRRVRLEAELRVNEVVSGKVQPDFAGDRVSVKDAYLKLDFDPAFQVLAGKAYKPFSLLEQTSSTRILPIERGAEIRGLDALDQYELVNGLKYSDRDVGLQVMGSPEGAPLGFSYAAGVFSGPLQQRTGNEASFQYAARATIQPVAPLTLGAAWSNRAFARPVGQEQFVLERGNAFEIDAEIGSFSPGFHLLGEVAFGDLDPFAGTDFLGAQAWLGYRTGRVARAIPTLEPILRVSYGDVEGEPERIGGTLLTPGINVYFGGLNRLMVNYDVWSPDGGDTEGSFKAQFQLAF